MFLVVSFVLILLAIALVAILDRTVGAKKNEDVRARAATQNILLLDGTVSAIDEDLGTLTVDNVTFNQKNRAGSAQNLGTWTVTPPPDFLLSSATPGKTITLGVDAQTFRVANHKVRALTVSLP